MVHTQIGYQKTRRDRPNPTHPTQPPTLTLTLTRTEVQPRPRGREIDTNAAEPRSCNVRGSQVGTWSAHRARACFYGLTNQIALVLKKIPDQVVITTEPREEVISRSRQQCSTRRCDRIHTRLDTPHLYISTVMFFSSSTVLLAVIRSLDDVCWKYLEYFMLQHLGRPRGGTIHDEVVTDNTGTRGNIKKCKGVIKQNSKLL